MKTTNFKFILAVTLLLGSFSSFLGSNAQAQSVSQDPYSEGTQTDLSPEEIRSIKVYLSNSKVTLSNLLNRANDLSYRESKDALMAGIHTVVGDSKSKVTETLMRYILNRATKVVNKIDQVSANTGTANVAGVVDQEVRVLKRSIEMALEYYQSDIAFINSQGTNRSLLPYAQFGRRYLDFLMQINESLLNSIAAYSVAWDALGFFKLDLYTDQNRDAYGLVLGDLIEFTQGHNKLPFPTTSGQAVNQMRKVRAERSQVIREFNEVKISEIH